MNSLFEICCENIRKNWDKYENNIEYEYFTEFVNDLLWENWYKKFNIKKEEIKELKHFLNDETRNILIFENLCADNRRNYHILCDKLGLHHRSINPKDKKNTKNYRKRRDIYITKPEKWLWEFTKNPYSNKSKEYYEKRRKQSEYWKKIKNTSKFNEPFNRSHLNFEKICLCDLEDFDYSTIDFDDFLLSISKKLLDDERIVIYLCSSCEKRSICKEISSDRKFEDDFSPDDESIITIKYIQDYLYSIK
jgi:hypothetical protein